jgi:hypothetical protein
MEHLGTNHLASGQMSLSLSSLDRVGWSGACSAQRSRGDARAMPVTAVVLNHGKLKPEMPKASFDVFFR